MTDKQNNICKMSTQCCERDDDQDGNCDIHSARGVLRKSQSTERIEYWRTWGIVEIAVRNPSVAEYMKHWEDRATKAEAQVARLTAPITEHEKANFAYNTMLGPTWDKVESLIAVRAAAR